ncbi:DUF4956 domain-containing protein [Serinibacter arcticus]|uniref:DUF4956 domain-containing protein n=1 Tax=Serinibacter arcticus TaxID=1655435 RepID=A0A2U1ZWY0_9MICO|nr:DUF4956 domain-containing protein [Serinibacter arcticus]PWD51488.1 DUF4956 domain-containing protein [Serinibacter arcticus]
MTISTTLTLLAADLAAIAVLVFGLYHPRHHRRDLVVAYLGINIGVFTVSATLASSAVGAGLGLGLLGVLSIIRLRSDELSQREVAYYFASLAIGLLGGLAPTPLWLAAAGMGLIVGLIWIADHPRLLPHSRSQTIVLDRAIADETELTDHLEAMLGADVRAVTVTRLDLVNDSTWVEVRYRLRPTRITTAEPTLRTTLTPAVATPATSATTPTPTSAVDHLTVTR